MSPEAMGTELKVSVNGNEGKGKKTDDNLKDDCASQCDLTI